MEEKKSINNFTWRGLASSMPYILIWAWRKQLYTHPIFAIKIKEYILSYNYIKTAAFNLTFKLGLTDENLVRVIHDLYKGSQRFRSVKGGIALQCLFLSKSFTDLSSHDFKKVNWVFHETHYTLKNLQDIRFKLGLSNEGGRPKYKSHFETFKASFPLE